VAGLALELSVPEGIPRISRYGMLGPEDAEHFRAAVTGKAGISAIGRVWRFLGRG